MKSIGSMVYLFGTVVYTEAFLIKHNFLLVASCDPLRLCRVYDLPWFLVQLLSSDVVVGSIWLWAGRPAEGESEQAYLHKNTASIFLLLSSLLSSQVHSWQCGKSWRSSSWRSHWKFSFWGQLNFRIIDYLLVSTILTILIVYLRGMLLLFYFAFMQFKMRRPQMCNILCRITLDAKSAKEFKEKIDDEYRVSMYGIDLGLIT